MTPRKNTRVIPSPDHRPNPDRAQTASGGPKQPYRIYREDDPAFAMAGLWEETKVDGVDVRSVTILTTEPNDLMEPIHDRMPVVLPRDEEDTWLSSDPEERRELCRP